MAERAPYAPPQCSARCADAAPFEAPHPCSTAGTPYNTDEKTAELARVVAAVDEVLARETADLARAKVIAAELEALEAAERAERQPSIVEAAEQIKQLAAAFEAVLPEAAALLRWIATDGQLTHAEGQRLTPKRRKHYERARARRREGHQRALDAMKHESNQISERIALAVRGIREAAALLIPERRVVSVSEDATDWCAEQESEECVAESERRAIARFREIFPTITSERMPDEEANTILHEMSPERPDTPSKNSAHGQAEWALIHEENERRRTTGIPKLRPISLEEQARVCMPVLQLLDLRPVASEDPIGAVREALDDGWKPREERFGVKIRDRAAATRPSTKTAPVSAETPSFDSSGQVRHVARHDGTRKTARRA